MSTNEDDGKYLRISNDNISDEQAEEIQEEVHEVVEKAIGSTAYKSSWHMIFMFRQLHYAAQYIRRQLELNDVSSDLLDELREDATNKADIVVDSYAVTTGILDEIKKNKN